MKPPQDKNWDGGIVHSCPHVPMAGWLLLSLLCACGADSNQGNEGRVIARVNGGEITARELSDQVARIESRPGADKKVERKRVLDALIDERLLEQRAIRTALDRKPETIAALDRARRQVLAQSAIDHAASGGRASYREVKAFYDGHPDLFERRKTYVFRRFDLPAGELQPSLRSELDKAGSPMQVGLILKRANVGFSDQTEIRAAEMLSSDVLKQAAEMQRGDILIFKEAGQTVLMQLVSSIAEPLDLARATPGIRVYLEEAKRKNAAESLLRDLRRDSKIEYLEGLTDSSQVQADAGPIEASLGAGARKIVTRVSASGASR